MKVLGVTGGIGSGKSYICKKFAEMGIPVYDSDSRTKELYNKSPKLLSSLVSLLGPSIVKKEGESLVLNKEAMASKIFADKALMEKVKEIVYPAVMQNFRRWKGAQKRIAEERGKKVPFVILESAVILENAIVKKDTDFVLAVQAPKELRAERVMKRDNISRKVVFERMASQWTDEKRAAHSDFILDNVPGKDLDKEIVKLYKKIEKR